MHAGIRPDQMCPLPVQLSGVSVVLLPHCHLWRQLLPPVAHSAWCRASQSGSVIPLTYISTRMHDAVHLPWVRSEASMVTLPGHLSPWSDYYRISVQLRSSPIELCSHVVHVRLLCGCGGGLGSNLCSVTVCADRLFKQGTQVHGTLQRHRQPALPHDEPAACRHRPPLSA